MFIDMILQLNIIDFFDYIKTIRYGYQDREGKLHFPQDTDFLDHNYMFSSPQEVVENNCGWCWDVANLISLYCKENRILHKCYFIEYQTKELHRTHTQVILKHCDQWHAAPDNSSESQFGQAGFPSADSCIQKFYSDYAAYIQQISKDAYDPGKLLLKEYRCQIPAGITDEAYMELVRNDEISFLLSQYNIHNFKNVQFIDSSHGASDIRHNYVIDKKYVLRINSVRVMTNDRLQELNSLIQRYRSFGMHAPMFLMASDGKFVLEHNGQFCYVSEYLDLPLADDVKEFCRKDLIVQRLTFVCKFAQIYKHADLSDTLSMYSLFELSPYDTLLGIEEKQDNFNNLIKDLQNVGQHSLAAKLTEQYVQIRHQLKAIYKDLPRCFFQGDENFSNLCVDEHNRIVGLFDFNMSGTEVIANYLANLAFQGNFYYTDEIMAQCTAEQLLDKVITSYNESTKLIESHYDFTQQEYSAYLLYSKVVIISRYCDQVAFSEYLQNDQHRDKVICLLELISERVLAC